MATKKEFETNLEKARVAYLKKFKETKDNPHNIFEVGEGKNKVKVQETRVPHDHTIIPRKVI